MEYEADRSFEVEECAMCPQENPWTGDIPNWQTRVINIEMQATLNTFKGHINATNTAIEAIDRSSGVITLNDTKAKEVPKAMLFIDGYLVDKKWEEKRQKMIEHEKKRWGGPYEGKKRGCCAVM